MIKLGVNIDHVATLRQVRRVSYPDIVEAATAAERGGADGITVHLREDRRHIQDDDVWRLQRSVQTKLNLEIAAVEAMVAIACRVKPVDVCLVPERREELTTEGGLDAARAVTTLRATVDSLREAGIRVSLFIDPDPRQIEASIELGVEVIEIHTGRYAEEFSTVGGKAELARIAHAARLAADRGLIVNAGHGLTLDNVDPIAALPEMNELNIGHSIVADAVFMGLEQAVRRMSDRLRPRPAA